MPASAVSRATPINTATRSGQLQALVAQGTPAAAFEAYLLLSRCDTAQTNLRNAHDPPAYFAPETRQQLAAELANGSAADAVQRHCGDLTAQQLGGRYALLQRAAEAGVPGAAVQFVQLPPAGMTQAELVTRWETPEVVRWREHALALMRLAATRADLDALMLLKWMYRESAPLVPKADPKMAYVYAVAYDAAYLQRNGKSPGAFHRQETMQLEAQVPANEVQGLREQGLKLAQGQAR